VESLSSTAHLSLSTMAQSPGQSLETRAVRDSHGSPRRFSYGERALHGYPFSPNFCLSRLVLVPSPSACPRRFR